MPAFTRDGAGRPVAALRLPAFDSGRGGPAPAGIERGSPLVTRPSLPRSPDAVDLCFSTFCEYRIVT